VLNVAPLDAAVESSNEPVQDGRDPHTAAKRHSSCSVELAVSEKDFHTFFQPELSRRDRLGRRSGHEPYRPIRVAVAEVHGNDDAIIVGHTAFLRSGLEAEGSTTSRRARRAGKK
jgi:hypothetical protein